MSAPDDGTQVAPVRFDRVDDARPVRGAGFRTKTIWSPVGDQSGAYTHPLKIRLTFFLLVATVKSPSSRVKASLRLSGDHDGSLGGDADGA